VFTIVPQFFHPVFPDREEDLMSRRSLVHLTLALVMAGGTVVPAAAATPDDPPAPACTQDTQQVKDLAKTLTDLPAGATSVPPDAGKLSQAAGDVFKSAEAAQAANCLPALPTSAPPVKPPAVNPAHPSAGQDAANCLGDVVKLLSAVLGAVGASVAVPPDPTALTKAVADVAAAVTALNNDKCLPVALPVPQVPGGLPVLAPGPVS
jgi:hypothetical protein